MPVRGAQARALLQKETGRGVAVLGARPDAVALRKRDGLGLGCERVVVVVVGKVKLVLRPGMRKGAELLKG